MKTILVVDDSQPLLTLLSTFPEESFGKRLQRIATADSTLAEALLLSMFTEAQIDERIAFLDGGEFSKVKIACWIPSCPTGTSRI